jgi:hypothetical protein
MNHKKRYIHLGADIAVPDTEIVGIFDADRTTVTETARDFLRRCQKSGGIYYVSLDLPRSYAVCDTAVFVTNVSAATLKYRLQNKNENKHK